VIRVYFKPFVDWIWGGCFIMALGGALAATDRRYRATRRERAAEEALAAQGAQGVQGAAP
jgi:cytochrome c-type biogenesis protein CcmF